MSVEPSTGKGKYYFRTRNQAKASNLQEKCNPRTPSPERDCQGISAHTPDREFAPIENQTMISGGQPVLGASAPTSREPATLDAGISNPGENAMLTEIRKMFSAFSDKIEGKLDNVILDLNSLKREVSTLKTTIRDLEHSAEDTSDRINYVETEKLPDMERNLTKLKTEIDEKLIQLELHNRKQNLLFYGIAPRPQEDIYATMSEVIAKLMNIPVQEAAHIPIINAHRLPTRKPAQNAGGDNRPDPVIVRFAKMSDRDKILHAFEYPRPNDHRSVPRPTGPRVTVRTDLPPSMKRDRGRLAHVGYELRTKQPGLKTRIKVIGARVILQTKKSSDSGSTWTAWTN